MSWNCFFQISQAKDETVTARKLAKEAYDLAVLAGNQSESMIQERTELLEKLTEYHNMVGATPAEIRNLALDVSHCLSYESIPTVENSLWRCFVTTFNRTVLPLMQHVSIMGRVGYFSRV